jgi:hypothetical protein
MPFPFSMSQLVPATSSQLPSISFGGKVAKGQSFEMDIGRKLTFRLIYSAGDGGGWTIWVGDKTQLDEDFSAYVTPPYRGPNSRDIEGWDFKRAELSDLQKIRRFYFVLNRSDYQFATDSLRKLMWPYEFSDMEVKQAYEARIALPKASGTLNYH